MLRKINIILLDFLIILVKPTISSSQRLYPSIEWSHILSGIQFKGNFTSGSPKSSLRYTAFPNLCSHLNLKLFKFLGVSIGLGIRNIGLILNLDTVEIKYRALPIHIPLTLKFGKINKPRLYGLAGFDSHIMVFFKEARYVDNKRYYKESASQSSKLNSWMPSIFVGAHALNLELKFQLALANFLNPTYPFDHFLSSNSITNRLWWISLSFHYPF